ncbi:MAG: hypothetical protein ACXVW0_09275 [Nocardioides sp.]
MTSTAGDPSASYAADVARLLWPAPWAAPYVTRSRRAGEPGGRDAYLFPSERHPRLLVPVDLPGASTMLRRLGRDGRWTVGAVRPLLEGAVRSRAFSRTRWPRLRVTAAGPGADSIERHLGECFGTEVRVGVLLGTRRVNQKPVLQVFDLEGTVRGYAKVGHNDLTAALVAREAAALAVLASHVLRSFRVPRVLHHGAWSGMEVLVLSALPTNGGPVPDAARLGAMREVSRLTGTTTLPLVVSGFWDRLSEDVEDLDHEPLGPRLRAAAARVEAADAGTPVTLGGWHGDWGPWNMGTSHGLLQLWDWERYDPQVPIGFDGLHFAAQLVRPGERHDHQQELAFLRSVSPTLTGLGVPLAQHDLTLRLYLLEMAVRYVRSQTYGATPALCRRTAWVLALLEHLSDLPTRPEGHR